MIDDLELYGLGAEPSPDDDRDLQLVDLFEAAGIEPSAAIPDSYAVERMPPVLNQHATPMCVAFSSAAMKAWQDRADHQPHRWYDFDEPRFFRWADGTPRGTTVRKAMAVLLRRGYPVTGGGDDSADAHRIRAYYAVEPARRAICEAILAFGPIVIATPWYRSWFRPDRWGVLPPPDTRVGGHAVVAYGWDHRGLRLRNSWGGDWGVNGDCFMPWLYLASLWEAWKASDMPAPKPKPAPKKRFVRVESGDTLSAIAIRARITLRKLLSFPENAKYRPNPSLIYPGQRVRVR